MDVLVSQRMEYSDGPSLAMLSILGVMVHWITHTKQSEALQTKVVQRVFHKNVCIVIAYIAFASSLGFLTYKLGAEYFSPGTM